ncbi:MAG: ATP-binding cassette domain-containing protein [Actinomycetota bacterium]
MRGVTVRYTSGDPAAVDDLTLSVQPGERIALIGPSGAGKSTILRLASGLTLPTTGEVTVLGAPSAELGTRANRRTRARVGVITQDFSLVGPLRVASNVAAGRLGRWSWLRAVGTLVRPGPIDEIAAALSRVGIAEKIWDRADQLSGGQQQRTAIARSLFQNPDLLLADEPVSALDPARSDAVMAVLADVAAADGKALIASMHDAPLAIRHCDRIVGLRNGHLQFDLPSAEVTDELLDALYLIDETADGVAVEAVGQPPDGNVNGVMDGVIDQHIES